MPDTTDSTTNTPPEAVGAASQPHPGPQRTDDVRGVVEKLPTGSPTPGPWSCDGCIVTAPAFYRDEPITHFEDGREQPNVTALVALVYDPRRCGDGWNARANARLIAAAPDLLAAAKVARETILHGTDPDAALQVIRAAIAKAEGR